ncbi:MAG: GNAT family N-acetyltransferase [Planctomycetota bacterium]|nr:GNAT family N-acetyltransferase [Planctomycetota bacterium]
MTWRTEVRPDDVAAVRDIVESTGFFHAHEVAVACELVEERLSKGEASGYHFLFAHDSLQPAPLGYACFGPIACTEGSFDLYWIAVHQRSRGAGMGRLIARRAEEIAAAMGARRMYAETSGRELYAPTRAFYERCGYVAEARLEDFYAPGDAKVIYARSLARAL